MPKAVLLGATALLIGGSMAFLACSGQSRQMVVGTDVGDSASKVQGTASWQRVDHSAWDRPRGNGAARLQASVIGS